MEFLNMIKNKLKDISPPAVYFSLKLTAVLIAQVYYGALELTKSVLPKLFTKSIKGDVILITGAASGIGRLLALKLAALGAVIVSLDINKDGNEETAKLVQLQGGLAVAFTVDLNEKSDIDRVCSDIKNNFGTVSMLINNAGCVSGNWCLDLTDDELTRTFNVNVVAHFRTIRHFLPDMIKQKKGHIVTIGSLAGMAGSPRLSDYCASKFAVIGLDDALRSELFMKGHSNYISTTIVCPFITNTGMFKGCSSKVMPILEPDYVAAEIVKGILLDKQTVILPWWSSIITSMRPLFPTRGFAHICEITGLYNCMDRFVGRK